MSEEIDNAALNVPRAIFSTMVLNGATGLAMVLAVLFCLGDIDKVIVGPYRSPFRFLSDYSSEYTHRFPIHPDILRWDSVKGRRNSHGKLSPRTGLVCSYRISCHSVKDDVVVCPRSRLTVSSFYWEGMSRKLTHGLSDELSRWSLATIFP